MALGDSKSNPAPFEHHYTARPDDVVMSESGKFYRVVENNGGIGGDALVESVDNGKRFPIYAMQLNFDANDHNQNWNDDYCGGNPPLRLILVEKEEAESDHAEDCPEPANCDICRQQQVQDEAATEFLKKTVQW